MRHSRLVRVAPLAPLIFSMNAPFPVPVSSLCWFNLLFHLLRLARWIATCLELVQGKMNASERPCIQLSMRFVRSSVARLRLCFACSFGASAPSPFNTLTAKEIRHTKTIQATRLASRLLGSGCSPCAGNLPCHPPVIPSPSPRPHPRAFSFRSISRIDSFSNLILFISQQFLHSFRPATLELQASTRGDLTHRQARLAKSIASRASPPRLTSVLRERAACLARRSAGRALCDARSTVTSSCVPHWSSL